jgi:branched-chain amino acid aminotransferase
MSFSDCRWVWKNGSLVGWQDATVHVSSHGLHFGTGVFEGIRCYRTESGPAVFRLSEHLDRLFASAAVYGMKIPYSKQELASAITEVVRANEFEACYVRPIALFGSETLSLYPKNAPVEVAIFAWPWGAYLGADALEKGVHATISPWRKFSSAAMPSTAKACGQYINSVLAVRDAVDRGFDEAILLDDAGNITEGSGENLFLVRNGELITNDEQHSVLMGITRDAVIRLARDMGYRVLVGTIHPDELTRADEAFFTGTAAEVTPLCAVDRKPIGDGKPGPITMALQQAFVNVVSGRDPRYQQWLSYVEQSCMASA